ALCSTVLLFAIHLPLALLTCCLVPLTAVGPRLLADSMRRWGNVRGADEGKAAQLLHQILKYQSVVRVFSLRDYWRKKLDTSVNDLSASTTRLNFATLASEVYANAGIGLAQNGIIATGAYVALKGSLDPGMFVAFLACIVNITGWASYIAFDAS